MIRRLRLPVDANVANTRAQLVADENEVAVQLRIGRRVLLIDLERRRVRRARDGRRPTRRQAAACVRRTARASGDTRRESGSKLQSPVMIVARGRMNVWNGPPSFIVICASRA